MQVIIINNIVQQNSPPHQFILPNQTILPSIHTEMPSVMEVYGYPMEVVGDALGIDGLSILLAELTKVCPDENADGAYLWECLNGTVENPAPVDAQRALVMHWVGYIFNKLYNERVLALWFPHQTTMRLTQEDATALRYHVEVLRELYFSNKTVPDMPKLVRQDNNATEINGKPVNQKRKQHNKRKRREGTGTATVSRTQTRCVPRRSKRLAEKHKTVDTTTQTLTVDDVVCGC